MLLSNATDQMMFEAMLNTFFNAGDQRQPMPELELWDWAGKNIVPVWQELDTAYYVGTLGVPISY